MINGVMDSSIATPAVNTPIQTTIPDTKTASPAADPTKEALDAALGKGTPAKAEPEEDRFSKHFALISKKEKALVREKMEIKAQREMIEKQMAEIEQNRGLKEKSALDILKAYGKSYEEATEEALRENTPEAKISAVQKQIEDMRKAQEDKERAALEEEKTRQESIKQEAVAHFKTQINEFLSTKSEDYELSNLFEQSDLVYDTMEKYYEKHQKVMSMEEAAGAVENHVLSLMMQSLATKKVQSKLAELGYSKKEAEPVLQQKNSTQPRTLSNDLTTSAAGFLPAKTEQDRISRALAALEK